MAGWTLAGHLQGTELCGYLSMPWPEGAATAAAAAVRPLRIPVLGGVFGLSGEEQRCRESLSRKNVAHRTRRAFREEGVPH